MVRSDVKSPEEIQEIIVKNAVKRGADVAMTKIISILGRTRPPFTHVRVGRTSQTVRPTGQPLKGYMVYNIFASSNPRIVAEIEKSLADWLRTCHGKRYENGQGGEAPVKQGDETIYLAVKNSV